LTSPVLAGAGFLADRVSRARSIEVLHTSILDPLELS